MIAWANESAIFSVYTCYHIFIQSILITFSLYFLPLVLILSRRSVRLLFLLRGQKRIEYLTFPFFYGYYIFRKATTTFAKKHNPSKIDIIFINVNNNKFMLRYIYNKQFYLVYIFLSNLIIFHPCSHILSFLILSILYPKVSKNMNRRSKYIQDVVCIGMQQNS